MHVCYTFQDTSKSFKATCSANIGKASTSFDTDYSLVYVWVQTVAYFLWYFDRDWNDTGYTSLCLEPLYNGYMQNDNS